MQIRFAYTRPPETPCPECKAYSFPISSENLSKYFFSEQIQCTKCNKAVDWWTTLLRHLDWGFPDYLFGLVGALGTSFVFDMKRNESVLLDFEKVGIPREAKILSIGYTPNGNGLWPIEIHGNSPIRYFNPHQIRLFGMPFGEPADSTPIAVGATWVVPSMTDYAWQNLIQAFEAYAIQKYDSSIIPANVAVESTLSTILQGFLVQYSTKERIEDFLDNRATYSHQLNILLPLAVQAFGFPKLPDHIRGNLNRLRELRNDLAHRGKLDAPLDKKGCALLLNSAVFGFGYITLLEQHMSRHLTSGSS